MRYVKARFEKDVLDKTYRIYVTDCLKCISGNTAHFAGGSEITRRYADVIKKEPEESRTSEEIIDNIRSKLLGLGGG